MLSLSACLLCKHNEGDVIFGCIYKVFVKKYFIRVWFWINLIIKGRNKKKELFMFSEIILSMYAFCWLSDLRRSKYKITSTILQLLRTHDIYKIIASWGFIFLGGLQLTFQKPESKSGTWLLITLSKNMEKLFDASIASNKWSQAVFLKELIGLCFSLASKVNFKKFKFVLFIW